MNQVKWLRISLVLMLALGLAIPAFAQVRDPRLSDSQEPGSVIVFPKFSKGRGVGGADALEVQGESTDPGPLVTEIEVGVVCPKGVVCPENTSVKIRFHWVCPGAQDLAKKFICNETDFDLRTTVNGKLVFNPQGLLPAGHTRVPQADCDRGYLIGWVINTSDQPIKFDGLIGDAVLRLSDTAVTAYSAIPIQADRALAHGALITKVPADNITTFEPSLAFDGQPGHYLAVTGKIFGDVRFNEEPSNQPPYLKAVTFLTLLTLDVRSNQPNLPVFVPLRFCNANEACISTSVEFVCWAEVDLESIDLSLTDIGMNTRKGLVLGGPAVKKPIFSIPDFSGPATLLGLVDTIEETRRDTGESVATQHYNYALFNDSVPVPTLFTPSEVP
jgi:hypothetical protein